MRDFVFYNPTRIIFGRKAADKIGEAVAAADIRSALLIYGKGSVKTTGLYDRVRASLAQAGVEVEDLSGVQPNPVVSISYGPLALEYILATGGSGYFRQGFIRPYLEEGRMTLVPDSPEFSYSAYVVHSTKADPGVMARIRSGLRAAAAITA